MFLMPARDAGTTRSIHRSRGGRPVRGAEIRALHRRVALMLKFEGAGYATYNWFSFVEG